MKVVVNQVTSSTASGALQGAVKKTLDDIIAAVEELQQLVAVPIPEPEKKPEMKTAPKTEKKK
jgi:hypothetical protein